MGVQLSARVAVRGLLLGLATVLVVPLALCAWEEATGPAAALALPKRRGSRARRSRWRPPRGG